MEGAGGGGARPQSLVVFSSEMLSEIAHHLPAKHIALLAATSRQHQQVLGADSVWKGVCDAAGFRQRSATRTRGSKPWREVYAANLCIECRQEGRVNIDLNGGTDSNSVLLPLCFSCFGKVSKLQYRDRTRHVLPRAWGRLGKVAMLQLFYKVPIPKCRKKKKAGAQQPAGT